MRKNINAQHVEEASIKQQIKDIEKTQQEKTGSETASDQDEIEGRAHCSG